VCASLFYSPEHLVKKKKSLLWEFLYLRKILTDHAAEALCLEKCVVVPKFFDLVEV